MLGGVGAQTLSCPKEKSGNTVLEIIMKVLTKGQKGHILQYHNL